MLFPTTICVWTTISGVANSVGLRLLMYSLRGELWELESLDLKTESSSLLAELRDPKCLSWLRTWLNSNALPSFTSSVTKTAAEAYWIGCDSESRLFSASASLAALKAR